MRRIDSLEKTLVLGKIEGRRRRGRQRMRWIASPSQRTWVWVNSGSWRWTGRPGVLRSMGSQRAGHDWATELNWNIVEIPPNTKDYTKESRLSLPNSGLNPAVLASDPLFVVVSGPEGLEFNCMNPWTKAYYFLLESCPLFSWSAWPGVIDRDRW